MCTKKAMLGCDVTAEDFKLRQGGIHSFMRPRSNPAAYAVNARCLDDFDLETASYEVKLFDGRNWEAAQEARLKAQRGEG